MSDIADRTPIAITLAAARVLEHAVNQPSEYAFRLRRTNRTPGTLGAAKGSIGLISILQEQVRKAGHVLETDDDSPPAASSNLPPKYR